MDKNTEPIDPKDVAGKSYKTVFPATNLEEHQNRLQGISESNPSSVLFTWEDDNTLDITVISFNFPQVFAVLTGLLSAMGMNIISGDVFTEEPIKQTKQRQKRKVSRRKIIDRFRGFFEPVPDKKAWEKQFLQRLSSLIDLLGQQKFDRTRQKINQWIAEQLISRQITPSQSLSPVEMSIDNSDPEYTLVSLLSEDTPFFLYTFSSALAQKNISIEKLRISTTDNRIEDDFCLTGQFGTQITDNRILEDIKLFALLTKHFTYYLDSAPDPFAALSRFEKIVPDLITMKTEAKWLELLTNRKSARDLARILGTSQYLWEDFIRQQYETLIPLLSQENKKGRYALSIDKIPVRLEKCLENCQTIEHKISALNTFKDRETMLMDMDHLLIPESDFLLLSKRLSRLAEAVVTKAFEIAYNELTSETGFPTTIAGTRVPYALFGLGKLGGEALGYASDIEILCIYSDSGETDGNMQIRNSEFFSRLVKNAVSYIHSKREGIFSVDLRLRPYGKSGPLASSLERFSHYYSRDGEAHSLERLSLVRLRTIGGEEQLGRQVENIRDELVYRERNIELKELRSARKVQLEKKTTPGNLNAKYSTGALVDLEYSVQILQIIHGAEYPILRTPSIHKALDALAELEVISQTDADQLVQSYHFLRQLINALRILRGNALDLQLPKKDSDEYLHLARRMEYSSQGEMSAAEVLHTEFETRTAVIRVFVENYFGRESLPGPEVGTIADLVLGNQTSMDFVESVLKPIGIQHPERGYINIKKLSGEGSEKQLFSKLAVLAVQFLRELPDPDMALNNWERFAHEIHDLAEHYSLLLKQPTRMKILLSVFSYSGFLSNTLLHNPEFFTWITKPEHIQKMRSLADIQKDLEALEIQSGSKEDWLKQLRIFRRREVLRIAARDICFNVETEEIVVELSNLADAVLITETKHLAKAHPELHLEDNLCILAFGKLGGRELNYSSDIDLLVLLESDSEISAAKINSIIRELRSDLSNYTPQGYVYRIDFRLRPFGTAGELAYSVQRLHNYYQVHAGLWEIQAAIKLRAVAGNKALGESFLQALEKEIRRPKTPESVITSIEKNRYIAALCNRTIQQGGIDIKNGRGGIRDIEFLVQGLILIYVDTHPEILSGNTVTALSKLAAHKIVTEEEEAFLRKSYIFFRKIEHLLQIYEDQQVHSVPDNAQEIAALAKRLNIPQTSPRNFMGDLNKKMSEVYTVYTEYYKRLSNTEKK
ncbi:MAG: glutamate-ammonia-ligase adenylyltransferase [Spirochaetia bacterium]